MTGPQIFRAALLHTPSSPFRDERALVAYEDGGLAVDHGRIVASGDYQAVSAAHPGVPTIDWRGGYLLPGFVDTHIHYPQLRVIGGLGRPLLEWLEHTALPEEARMRDDAYAINTARAFVRALATHGTTTALVFGAHFATATAALFDEAARSGLRIITGLVVSDRLLRPELHQSPVDAYRDSETLIRTFHRQGRLLYAVTPRFAMSATEAMLEMCGALLQEHEGLRFQTHLNENLQEVAEVNRLFPWARDYFGIYEHFGLSGSRAVMAHSVWTTDDELQRMATSGTAVAHCPCSNASLGSGTFPMRRHLDAGVRIALGTDVGGGIGFGMPKEALHAYLMQRVADDGVPLDPSRLLYLATRAGAEALGLEAEIGDLAVGKAADFVCIRPPAGSPLAHVLERADGLEQALAAIFTLAGAESVHEVRVEGTAVHRPTGES
jgi:guanine deaminase